MKMNNTPVAAWEAMRAYYEAHKDKELKGILFNNDSKEAYIKDFISLYKNIKKKYMSDEAKELDRHKQAAILLYCTMNNEVLKQEDKTPNGKIFVACEKMGLMLSLSFMKDLLNRKLSQIGEKEIEKYALPQAFSCDTDYFDILIRDLYLQKHKDEGVYILFLAHILYLIEYNTLYERNPEIIKKLKEDMSASD